MTDILRYALSQGCNEVGGKKRCKNAKDEKHNIWDHVSDTLKDDEVHHSSSTIINMVWKVGDAVSSY